MIQEIGELLKRQRQEIGISQKEVARRLGYKNVNFISMMESGGSLVPMNRVRNIVLAYELNEEMTFILFAFINKPVWDALLTANKKISDNDPEMSKLFKRCWLQYERILSRLGMTSCKDLSFFLQQ